MHNTAGTTTRSSISVSVSPPSTSHPTWRSGLARFAAYDRQVRAEYAHVEDAAWRAGRRRVLQGFLDRDAIYGTQHFRAACEAAARSNLDEALARLSG